VTQPGVTTLQPPSDLKDRIKKSFDAIATTYDRWSLAHRTKRLDYATKLIQLLAADAKKIGYRPPNSQDLPTHDSQGNPIISLKGKHALEVGCGSGIHLIEALLAKDLDVVGVDISRSQIIMALDHFPIQTKALKAAWVWKDMMDLRYPNHMFDVIVALYSLIHLPREEQTVFLHRAIRWLRPGGMLMINFLKDEVEGETVENWLGHEKGWIYRSGWGEEKTLQIIERHQEMEVIVKEETHDAADAHFVFVIARKAFNAPLPPPIEEPEPVEAGEQVEGTESSAGAQAVESAAPVEGGEPAEGAGTAEARAPMEG
jgi:2-polyprenyl-3-methyl-5-hydroxy-6-metoxy-1,4-benzoquinol methylase